MSRPEAATISIVKGVDVETGLVQVREEVTVPQVIVGYIDACQKAYSSHAAFSDILHRFALVRARQEIERDKKSDFIAAKLSFLLGGVLGLRAIECGSDSQLVADMHTFMPTPTKHSQPLSSSDVYLNQLVAITSLCELGAEAIAEVDMPLQDWTEQMRFNGRNQLLFEEGVAVMSAVGCIAGEERARRFVADELQHLEQEW